MLEHVNVKGFRSLRDFHLEIREGLNVLVGPNGAGKTNIILLFEFLRSILSRPLSQAVGTAGGVAQVFSKKGKVRFEENIDANVAGRIKVGNKNYRYFFEFAIKFNKANQDVSFSHQRIVITTEDTPAGQPYLDISFDSVAPIEPEKDRLKHHLSSEVKKNSNWIAKELPAFSKRGFFRQNALPQLLIHSDEVASAVARDFSGRFVLNVVPSHVKKAEDITRKPGIETDGSGVSSTLFAIKRKRAFYDDHAYYYRHPPEPIHPNWQNVINLIRIAVPSIEDVEVVSDPFDNLLRCQITVGKGNRKSVVPLSSMSDGTVKWISLILRLASSRAALLLEEPENYLHPLMQREIVRLLRDSTSDAGFTIVSTHSETLLNAVRADELVVVSYGPQGTKARRVTNAEDVEAEINQTGFGLGYYYLADAVEAV